MESTTYTKQDVAGAVILYNSPDEVTININTYINQVDKLYVVDNSTEINHSLVNILRKNSKVAYYPLGGNQGIATALNVAAKQALADRYSLLLTMDDDTRTPLGMVDQLLNFWNTYKGKIGILSGVHHNHPDTAAYNSIQYTLTSGNLLNLEVYDQIGGFMDDLFIDHVDHEYGFRLIRNGYEVIEIPSIRLDHTLGYSQSLKFGNWKLRNYGTNSPIRLYYYARNGLYLSKIIFSDHPDFSWMYTKEMIRRWIKTLFLDKDRSTRVTMLWKGMVDGWNGRLGNFNSMSGTGTPTHIDRPKSNKLDSI